MKTYTYSLTFSPYMNIIKAKNRKEAWKKICALWANYDCKKIATLN